MDQATIQRVIGIVCVGYAFYQFWGITGIVLTAGLALCNKI